MKYKMITTVLFVFYAINGLTQSLCNKGTFILGTNLITYNPILNITSTSYRNDTMTNKNSKTYHGVSYAINFQVGYFVRDNLCIGVAFPDLGSLSNNSTFLTTEIFSRYYFKRKSCPYSLHDGRTTWYLEGSLVGGYNTMTYTTNTTDPTKASDLTGNVGIAFSCLVTKNIAIDVLSMYEIDYISSSNPDAIYIGSVDKSVSINNCINAILRLEIFL